MGVMKATDQVTIVEGGIGDTTELETKVEELNNNLYYNVGDRIYLNRNKGINDCLLPISCYTVSKSKARFLMPLQKPISKNVTNFTLVGSVVYGCYCPNNSYIVTASDSISRIDSSFNNMLLIIVEGSTDIFPYDKGSYTVAFNGEQTEDNCYIELS